MYHLDNTSGVPEMPEPKDTQTISTRWFGESQEQGGISWPGADWFNIIQAELLAILELADESPDKAKFNQIATAINKISNEFSLRMSESTGPTLVGYGDNETLKINLFKRLRQIRIIEEFGATGDGITDDSDAFERAAEWLAGGDYRALHTSSDARYRITRNIVFNFNRGAGAALFMKSPITPTGFSGEVLSFINGRDVDLILYVDGGCPY